MSGFGIDSSQTMSLSDAITKSTNEMLFSTLLNNPQKRAQVLELLTQEGIVGRDENSSPNSARSNKYYSPIKRLQKNNRLLDHTPPKSKAADSSNTNVRLESPSALGRRRALQRLESVSSADEPPSKLPSPPFVGTPKPFERLLEGVVAYCEIRSNGEDRSTAIKAMIQTMGAKIKDNLCKGVTHVILKDGLYTTYRKAKLMKIHVVSVLWLESVRKHKFRVPESKFPAVCADAYDADITKICQGMQKDYDDVIQEELIKTTEFDNRRLSESPMKFVTDRKKSVKSRSTIYGSDYSRFKTAHNRTEIASPYKYKCNEPELSESDSYVSVGSNSNKSLEIVPCSQDCPPSLSINHFKTTHFTNISEEDDIFPETNLARNVKNSFELEKASKIRSPESLLNQSRLKKVNQQNISYEKEDSLRLHITTTDESNLNSTGNRSKSNNTSSPKNLLGNDIFPVNKDSNSNRNNLLKKDKIWNSTEELNSNKIISTSNENNQQINDENFSKNNLEGNLSDLKPCSSISSGSFDVDVNKNKTRRRTTVGLKRPVKINNLNQNVDNISTKTLSKSPKIKNASKISSPVETNDNQSVTPRNTRRKTLANVNTENKRRFVEITDDNIEENENNVEESKSVSTKKSLITNNNTKSVDIAENSLVTNKNQNVTVRKSRRKTLGNINTENKTKSVEIDENITEDNENTRLENNDNQSVSVRKPIRKTLGNINTENKTKSAEIDENIIEDNENTRFETNDNQSVSVKKSRRKTLGNITKENKIKSVEIEENITEDNENNLERNENQSVLRKSRRKTICNVRVENKTVSVENNVDSPVQKTKKNKKNATLSDSSAEKNKRRVRKLFDPNQEISISHINWDEEPELEQQLSSVSPAKKGKYQVPIKELPKILSAKAQIKTKSTNKNITKSVPAKIMRNVDNKNKRKSARVLNFNSTSSETSDLDCLNPVVRTPSRKSERIAKTPAKTLKIIESRSESEQKSSDTETSDCSVKLTIKSKTRKSRFISSQASQENEENTPRKENINKKNIRTKFLKTEETKRRSTLDFVRIPSKQSLEQMKSSQKPKQPKQLPSIVCTRLHKSDVQVFQQIVKKLGGFVVEDEVTKRTTHLICGGPSRTVNMLRAIVRGCWVLKQEWLYKSLEAGKWLEEEDFELVEFSPTVQKCRVEKQSFGSLYSMDLFVSCGPIFICRGSIPRFSDLEELVELCGGRIVSFAKDAKIVVGEYAAHQGVVCVTEKWILDSITHNRMKKFKSYLFKEPIS